MKLTFLSDNTTEKSCCHAEWVLSILIESGGHKVLFYLCASDMFARNAASLGVELGDVEAVALSHGHYDHTEGMEAFCRLNSRAPIYIHREAFGESYALDENGNVEDRDYGLLWSRELIDRLQPRLVRTSGVTDINETMTLVGDIPLLDAYPMTEKFFRRAAGGVAEDGAAAARWVQDPMNHEQFLAVREDEGIFLFSGCSHKGVMSIIARAQELFTGQKLRALIAGMHLYVLPKAQQAQIVNNICALGLEWVFPVHCTGMEAIVMFKERLGEKCVIASAGQSYEL